MSKIQDLFGLLVAYEWDTSGNPTKVKLCTKGEVDYFVLENELGRSLLPLVRTCIGVRGKVLQISSMRVIDIKHINQECLGG